MVRLPLPLAALAAASFAAHGAISPPGGLAPRLQPSAFEAPAFVLSASGVNVFECRLAGGDSYAWTFTAPDATLYDGGRSIGTFKTPNLWESTSDRSSVSGVVQATQPNGGHLPLALIRAVPTSESGMFAGVTSIQRVNTSGGVAPVGGCGAGTAGAEAHVEFTADFYFYKRRGAG